MRFSFFNRILEDRIRVYFLITFGACVVVQACFFSQITLVDAVRYWAFSLDPISNFSEPKGQLADYGNLAEFGAARLGVVLPLFLSSSLFGPGLIGYHLFPLMFHSVTLICIYLITKRFFGSNLGLLAMFIYGIFPVVLAWSTQVLPDQMAIGWLTLSFAIALGAVKLKNRLALPSLLSGVALGLAYLSREQVLMLAPLILYSLFEFQNQVKRMHIFIQFIFGMMSVLVFELVSLWVVYGNPFIRIESVLVHSDGSNRLLAEYGKDATVLTVLERAPSAFWQFDLGKLALVAVAISILCLPYTFTRKSIKWKAWRVICLWSFMWWVLMLIMAGLLNPMSPKIRDNQLRYWQPLLPAWAIISAVIFALVFRFVIKKLTSKSSRVSLINSIAILSLVVLPGLKDLSELDNFRFFIFGKSTPTSNAAGLLASSGAKFSTIWVPPEQGIAMELYLRNLLGKSRWNGDVRQFKDVDELNLGDPVMYFNTRHSAPKGSIAEYHSQSTIVSGNCSKGYCITLKTE